MLINRLLIACVCHHFDVRHSQEVPEADITWTQQFDSKSITHVKGCKQVLARINSQIKRSNL